MRCLLFQNSRGSESRLGLLLLIATLAVSHLPAQDAPLVAERDWTSSDGKTIRAELVGFERGAGIFRTPEGRRFPIPDERFSTRDQVPIFVARVESLLDRSYAEDLNTDFYYSKHIPSNRRRDKDYSYVAFGPGRFNLAYFLNDDQADFYQYDRIVVRGSQNQELATYHLRESDRGISTHNGKRRTWARISVNYGREKELLRAIGVALKSDCLTFVARGQQAEMVINPDDSEKNSLRDTMKIFQQASALIGEGFLRKDRLTDQWEESAPQTDAAANEDPLSHFRSQLAQKKYGDLLWKSESVSGVGYLGTQVVVARADGELLQVPFEEISSEGRNRLFEKRIEEAFGDSRFVHDSGTTMYLHRDWDRNRITYCQAILLVRLSDGEYHLRANAWTSRLGEEPVTSISIRGNRQKTPFPVACLPEESRTRNRSDGGTNRIASPYLDSSEQTSARELIGSETIEFRISSKNRNTTASLKEDEIEVTSEAISLFEWSKHL